MLVYNHLRKSALTPDDLGVGAVCFMVIYHENSEAKKKGKKNMLQIQHIRKEYKTGKLVQKALDDVSLNLRDNEFVAILGPSGSGKTTLLNIIGGLDRYDSGDLIINGISTKKYKDRDWDSYRNHTIGFVFQSYNLIPHQTLLANVELALTISGVGKAERRRRAKEALEKVGLGEQIEKRPSQLSGGQMQIGALLGPEEFLKYQKIFNFGATTGIDLPGEATGILHTEESLSSGSTELASASFGQGYTCTMIQEIAAICSVINGGYYYQPHVVSKILNEDGDVIKDVQPVVTKQTVSSDVSALIRQYMGTVMESDGTGAAAKVDGYSMGGKTGTAQKYPREDKKYLVSFIGFAPLDDPQVVVYVVVDEPNTEYQADSLYAQYIYKGVMTEILPYLNIFQDEEVTDKANAKMTYLENLINQQAESNRQSDSTDDTTTAAPPEDDCETKLDNKQESEGITDEEAAIQSGN